MVWTPVFRGTPPKPLFIVRGAAVPAWSEDACSEECCEPLIPCGDCDLNLSTIDVELSGFLDGTFSSAVPCESFAEANGTYSLSLVYAGVGIYCYEVTGLEIVMAITYHAGGTVVLFYTLTGIKVCIACGTNSIEIFTSPGPGVLLRYTIRQENPLGTVQFESEEELELYFLSSGVIALTDCVPSGSASCTYGSDGYSFCCPAGEECTGGITGTVTIPV